MDFPEKQQDSVNTMQGNIAKDIYLDILGSSSNEYAGSTSVQTHNDLHNSNPGDLWYADDEEDSTEKLNMPSDMDREWQRRHDQFNTIGYRDGLLAGQEASAQEGFNTGFKESVSIGYNWGLVRGITRAMAFLPDGLKERLVQTEETRNKFQCLHESIHSLSTTDALKLFHDDQKHKSAHENENDEPSSTALDSNSQSPNVRVFQNYSEELQSLISESPLLSANTELNQCFA